MNFESHLEPNLRILNDSFGFGCTMVFLWSMNDVYNGKESILACTDAKFRYMYIRIPNFMVLPAILDPVCFSTSL